MQITPELLIDTMEKAGFEPRGYSGTGMYGKQCVSVVIQPCDMWDLGYSLGKGQDGFEITEPRTEDVGTWTLVYWPEMAWPEGDA